MKHLVRNVHVKDSRGGFEDWYFPAVGDGGAVDFTRIREILDGVGFNGPYTGSKSKASRTSPSPGLEGPRDRIRPGVLPTSGPAGISIEGSACLAPKVHRTERRSGRPPMAPAPRFLPRPETSNAMGLPEKGSILPTRSRTERDSIQDRLGCPLLGISSSPTPRPILWKAPRGWKTADAEAQPGPSPLLEGWRWIPCCSAIRCQAYLQCR